MTAASVRLTHIFDNQIDRMTQRLLSLVVLSCILSVSFSGLFSNTDVYVSVFSFWHFYHSHPLPRPTVQRIFFLSRSNWHIDILMFKPHWWTPWIFCMCLCHGTLTVPLPFITTPDDVWCRQHIFTNSLDSSQGLCFYCFLLSSSFHVFWRAYPRSYNVAILLMLLKGWD